MSIKTYIANNKLTAYIVGIPFSIIVTYILWNDVNGHIYAIAVWTTREPPLSWETAWDELRTVMNFSGEAGLLLGVSGHQVLLDGVPLEKRPTDRSFAQLLNSAGLASINFAPRVTIDDFWRLCARLFVALAQSWAIGGGPERRPGRGKRSNSG